MRLAALLVAGTMLTVPGTLAQRSALRGAAPDQPPRPTLLIMLVVDQMRFEYLERYGHAWTHGLKRLLTGGASFDRTFYPYLNTVTCAGHATIATGAYPYRHGVIMNEWFARAQGRTITCTEDATVESVPYAPPPEPIGHSARRLRVPTLGDRLRAASPQSRVVALSMKPRSTVMLAGQGGTAVTWFSDTNSWATSTAYATAPVPSVRRFLEANPVERQRDVVWDRVRDERSYSGRDDDESERPRRGWDATFPHPLAGAPGTETPRFFDLWERSPFSDAYLADMAAALVREHQLGQRGVTDVLGISFSGLDYVGHDFGPDSHEVQDALLRLDRTLGALLDTLDALVGRDQYAIGLSSDHGVSAIPEALRARGLSEAGRVLNAEVKQVAESAMTAAHGPGPHVAHVEYTNLYLTPAARTRAAANPAFLAPAIDAVTAMPGVQRVFRGDQLPRRRDSEDVFERAAALSHHPEESGDLVVILDANWIGTNTSAATHGSAQPYDQHVPLLFYGQWFTPGRHAVPASPADLAPTLAALVRLPMPDVDGRVLADALRLRP